MELSSRHDDEEFQQKPKITVKNKHNMERMKKKKELKQNY